MSENCPYFPLGEACNFHYSRFISMSDWILRNEDEMQTSDFSPLIGEENKESFQQQEPTAEEYTWSATRVVEQVTINVISASVIGFFALLFTIICASFLWFFHFIPLNWLLIVIIIPTCTTLILLVLIVIGWFLFRRTSIVSITERVIIDMLEGMAAALAKASETQRADEDTSW